MDDPRQPSLEARESGENTENPEQQRLDDATFEPRSMVEQTGDYRQAESIQNNLTALVENANPAEESVTAVAPHVPGAADRSKVTASPGEGEGDSVDAIPITVPDVQASPEQTGYLPIPIPEPRESQSAETPEENVPGGRPRMNEGPFEPAGSGAGDPQDITPINLPNIRRAADASKAERVAQPKISPTPGKPQQMPDDALDTVASAYPIPDGAFMGPWAGNYEIKTPPNKKSAIGGRPPIRDKQGKIAPAVEDNGKVDAAPIPLSGDPEKGAAAKGEDRTSIPTDQVQRPQERIVFTKPDVLPGGMDQQQSSLGHLEGPGGAVKAIADFISGGGRSGMEGDPFAHGGPLPGGANETGGFGNEGGIPSNPLGKASDAIGEMLDFVNRHPGGEDPGKTGGGPGSINPKYGRGQASDTASDVQNEFMNYCKKAYDSGDTPKGRDVQPWIAGKAAEFFGEKLGKDEPLVGVLKEMSTQTEKPTTTTVTRSTDAPSSQGTSTTGVPQEVDPEDPPTMGHPDGSVGDGQKGPVTADDIDKSKAAGTFVKDPANDQGGSSGSALLGTKHPGQITDYGYEGGKPPSDGGIRNVRDQLTDPPETAAGELSSLDQAVAFLSVRVQDLMNNEKSNSGQQSSDIKKKSDQTQEDVVAKMK
jgi:hypothetical protein